MKKLLTYKEWLTIPETTRHLSILFEEDVNEADVLRLALERRLTLSVNFVNAKECLLGPIVPFEEARRDARTLDTNDRHPIEGLLLSGGLVIECGNVVEALFGVWDIAMLGSEQIEIEQRYQSLTNGPVVSPTWLRGLIFRRGDAYCQLVERRPENETTRDALGRRSRINYRATATIPADAVLVVRTSELRALEARLGEPAQKAENPLGERERRTLLVMIAALAKMADIDVTKPSKAAVAIESQTIDLGARISTRALEDHLKRIPSALEALKN